MVPLFIFMVINFADKAAVSRSGPARVRHHQWRCMRPASGSPTSYAVLRPPHCAGGDRRHGGTAAARLGHCPLDLTLGLRLTLLGRPNLVCIVARLRPRRLVGQRERKDNAAQSSLRVGYVLLNPTILACWAATF
jgi:hypothetical protein